MDSAIPNVPGVYRRERTERAAPLLPTGVPGFVGLVNSDGRLPPGAATTTNGFGPVALRRKADFSTTAPWYLGHAVNGFFDNGGDYCYVVGVRADVSNPAQALIRGLELLMPVQDVDLIAIPDAMSLGLARDQDGKITGALDEPAALSVQASMVQHCTEHGTRLALLDALPSKAAQALITSQIRRLGLRRAGAVNAALYHPWVRTLASKTEFVPPSGHVAGVIARTDALSGVFKAPANTEVQGATDLDADLDFDSLSVLNDAGVNCLRSFAARGIRIWGARTLSVAPEWRYLNVRRLVLTILRWIELNMAWASFEPNTPSLWSRIERELTTYLTGLWRAGALQGDSADAAFYVRCDAERNPPASRLEGQVITEIGLAAARPAEFIVLSVQHRAGTTELI